MDGMRSLAVTAHAIERRNAHPSGKVSVRAAAHRRLFELPANLVRDCLRFFVESSDSSSALHRHAVNTAFDVEFAMLVKTFQRANSAIQACGLLCPFDADINFYAGFGSYYVGACAPVNDSRIYRDSPA